LKALIDPFGGTAIEELDLEDFRLEDAEFRNMPELKRLFLPRSCTLNRLAAVPRLELLSCSKCTHQAITAATRMFKYSGVCSAVGDLISNPLTRILGETAVVSGVLVLPTLS
jgi:hypothetical protein